MVCSHRNDALILNAVGDLECLASQKQKLSKPPPFYRVVMLNDDFTPMDFVVEMLRIYFGKGEEEATVIMLSIHHQGRGICGVYPQDIACTKVDCVMSAAQRAQYPLQCIMEVL